jgi:cytochrome b pre-mRNA-processing protein 3
MSLFQRLFGPTTNPRDAYRPLYDVIVARGRAPIWYLDGAPDTVDGRFDMIAAIMSAVLVRLEDAPEAKQPSVYVAELFIDDMDGQLRQIGIGDVTVGKHIGKMMGALGGRLTVYREANGDTALLRDALVRNLWRGSDSGVAADAVAARLATFTQAVRDTPVADILAGTLPPVAQGAAS